MFIASRWQNVLQEVRVLSCQKLPLQVAGCLASIERRCENFERSPLSEAAAPQVWADLAESPPLESGLASSLGQGFPRRSAQDPAGVHFELEGSSQVRQSLSRHPYSSALPDLHKNELGILRAAFSDAGLKPLHMALQSCVERHTNKPCQSSNSFQDQATEHLSRRLLWSKTSHRMNEVISIFRTKYSVTEILSRRLNPLFYCVLKLPSM